MAKPFFLSLALAAAAVLLASPTAADVRWVRVRSPHFEVLSDAGEAPAREAARRLERLRIVFLKLFPNREDARRLITVLVLQERSRFLRLVPRERRRAERLAGFFQGGSERDYAVAHLSPDQLRPFEVVEHEYAHLILNASLQAQPVWVAEGLAEILSGALLNGREARLGAARPEYDALLRHGTDLPLERVLAVGYDSPEYLGSRESGLLYARSWALVRWVIHRRGLAALRSFVGALAAGQEHTVAFAERLGDLADAETSLSDVPAGPLLRVATDGEPEPPLEVDVPAPADIEHRLGDLLFRGGHTGAAQRRFESALEADPGHLPSRASLGGLLVAQGKWEAGRRELDAALEIDPDDPAALLRLARLHVSEALQRGAPLSPEVEAQVVAGLERALEHAPQLYEAALLLAHLRVEHRMNLIELLEPLFEQQPDRTGIAQTLSQLHLQRGDVTAARRVLERGRDAARDPAHRYLCAHLLARLEAFSAATVEVRGDLIYLECRPDGSLLFTIAADPATLRLEAASTRSFFVHGADETEPQVELLCGNQDRPLVLRFDPAGSTDPAVSGSVLWLALDRSSKD